MQHRLMILLTALVAATALLAQRGPGGPRGDGSFTPEQMVEQRVKRLTSTLELTTTQQEQAKAIFTDEVTATKALQPKMTEARQALEAAIETTGLDADIERAAAQLGAVQVQMTTINGKAQAKLRSILTAEQKTKLDSAGPGRGMQGFGRPGSFGAR